MPQEPPYSSPLTLNEFETDETVKKRRKGMKREGACRSKVELTNFKHARDCKSASFPSWYF